MLQFVQAPVSIAQFVEELGDWLRRSLLPPRHQRRLSGIFRAQAFRVPSSAFRAQRSVLSVPCSASMEFPPILDGCHKTMR